MNSSSGTVPVFIKNKQVQIIIGIVLAALLIVVPNFMQAYYVDILVSACLCAYIAQCWNLMCGYAGQFSFGHVAFFGVGAYTSSLLYVDFGLSPIFGIFAGAAVAGLVGLFIGFLSFKYKLQGDYFALITLAFAEMFRVIVTNVGIFKKAVGVSIDYRPDWRVFQPDSKVSYFYIILGMTVVLTVFLSRLSKTKMGLYFVSIREDENAASALGVDAFRYKLIATTLSAALTALGGTFYAQYYLFIDPSIAFNSNISINAIVPCILGGVGTIFGPIIGALIITPISQLTNLLAGSRPGFNMMIYGSLLVVFIIAMPNGIVGSFRKRKTKKGMPQCTTTSVDSADVEEGNER